MVYIVILHIWKKYISGDWLRLVICCLEMQQICPDHFEYCTFYYTSAIYRTKVNDYNSNFQADESYSESDLFTF